MKNVIQKLLLITLLFTSVQTIAQTSTLSVNLYVDEFDYKEYNVSLLKGSDTIGKYTFETDDLPLKIDSLEAGDYRIFVSGKNSSGEYMVMRSAKLEDDMETNVDISLYLSESIAEPEDLNANLHQKSETQFGLGYFNGSWIDPKTVVKDNFSLSFDAYYWNAFSKHTGFLLGSGFHLSQHYFQKDTTYFENIAFKKIFERYTYFSLNYEAKFRISTGDQQSEDLFASKFFIDLGARYNFPVVFNHSAMYRGSKKLIERNIHDFNDFRAFVNIGYAPVTFFMEYRLTDFIRADNPQLPKFNAGIKVMVSY